jgi:hypothetical protein
MESGRQVPAIGGRTGIWSFCKITAATASIFIN